MKRGLLIVQMLALAGQIFAACPSRESGGNPPGKPTPHDRTHVSSPSDLHSDPNKKEEAPLTPVAASIANAKRVVSAIPDINMDVTVVKPSQISTHQFTMEDLMKEQQTDTTQFPNHIDDYDLGPNASF